VTKPEPESVHLNKAFYCRLQHDADRVPLLEQEIVKLKKHRDALLDALAGTT
jgi:hypothetical protein